MAGKGKQGVANTRIAENRKARHEYNIEETYEAGIVLEGWEVKSLRSGKGGIADSYVIIKDGAPYLLNANIQALHSASTHVHPEPSRTRKLLLHQKEILKLTAALDRKGYTLVPLSLYWKKGFVKVQVAVAVGKKNYDKRESDKKREWKVTRARLLHAKHS